MGLFGFGGMKQPVRGTARVVGASRRGVGDGNQECRISLLVQGPGVAPFSAVVTEDLPAHKWPWEGQSLPATVDAAKTDRFEIEWDELVTGSGPAAPRVSTVEATTTPSVHVETRTVDANSAEGQEVLDEIQEMTGMNLEEMTGVDIDGSGAVGDTPAAMMPQVPPPPPTSAPPPPEQTPANAAAELADGLERLVALRDRGVLTDAEYEEQKARLLAGH